MSSIEQHNLEIHNNRAHWSKKPLLEKVYGELYKRISSRLINLESGMIVEIGSGIGIVKEFIPQAVTTDLFTNPWIDRVEDAYNLSFESHSVSNLILLDVFHHLQYPGKAFKEFNRVLLPGGRLVICDPCVSLLGLIVYGVLHHEPLGLTKPITWEPPNDWSSGSAGYYAAQSNCWRVFSNSGDTSNFKEWKILEIRKFSDLSYVFSGGFSKPQIYPSSMYQVVKFFEIFADVLPFIFATRMLVVMEPRKI